MEFFQKLRLQYGDFVHWHEFGTHYLLLNSYSSIRDALVLSKGGGEIFTGRLDSFFRKFAMKNRGKMVFFGNTSTYGRYYILVHFINFLLPTLIFYLFNLRVCGNVTTALKTNKYSIPFLYKTSYNKYDAFNRIFSRFCIFFNWMHYQFYEKII